MPPRHERTLIFGKRRELLNKPRFSDPRLTAHEHDAATASERVVEGALHAVELDIAAHKGRPCVRE